MSTTETTALPVNRPTITAATNTHNGVFGDLYANAGSERSYFGYHESVLKSGIQKYARRAKSKRAYGVWPKWICLVCWNGMEPALNDIFT